MTADSSATANTNSPLCSRRMFILGTASTFAGAFLAACGTEVDEKVAKTDVPVGSAVILDGFIIAQPTEGEFVAFSNVCPHQSAPITQVEGDVVRCPKHGSTFSIADGKVLTGPAEDDLKEASIVDGGDSLAAQNL